MIKSNGVTSGPMELGQDFILHCSFWDLGVMLPVSNMNERLKKRAFQHIIKIIISYLISSQLNRICDMKINTFWRITSV